MASSLPRYIVSTMLASFFFSFALMYWQRKFTDPPSLAVMPVIAVNSSVPRQPPASNTTIDARRRPESPAGKTAAVEDNISVDSTPGEEASSAELPIAFHIRNRRDLNKIDGDIRNISSRQMSITLSAVNSSTQAISEIHFELAPGERRTYSNDEGLFMQPDDQLIVHSPPYQDRVVRVP